MKYLNGVYSQGFNVRHRRVGHLLQGRYTSRLVEQDSYLLALARYIVQNPVRANLCERVEDWEWSSFRATAGISSCPPFLRADLVLGLFDDEPAAARKAYVKFVHTPAVAEPWVRIEPDRTVRSHHSNAEQRTELASILLNTMPREDRNRQIVDAYLNHGYTMSEIAEFLECHVSNISKIISAMRGKNNSHQSV